MLSIQQIVCLILALGLASFWLAEVAINRNGENNEPWPGHYRHERSFLVPDLAIAIILVVAFVYDDSTVAPLLRMIAGGALLFLSVLDMSYLHLTWSHRTTLMKLRTLVVSMIAGIGGALLIWV